MVGISTRQNTTNVFPAIQLGLKAMLFLETELARKRNWSNGSLEVLKGRGFKKAEVYSFKTGEDSRIDKIKRDLYQDLNAYDSVVFNLGGGQKAQQIGVWEVFKARNNPKDAVCYANMDLQKIEIWREVENDRLSYESLAFNSTLKIAEILAIFGREMHPNYKVLDNPFHNELFQLYHNSDLKNYIHGLRKKEALPEKEAEDEKIQKMLPYFLVGVNRKWLLNKFLSYHKAMDSTKRKEQALLFMHEWYSKLRNSPLSDYFSLFNNITMPDLMGEKLLKLIDQNDQEKFLLALIDFVKKDLPAIEKQLNKEDSQELINIEDAEYLPKGEFHVNDFSLAICGDKRLGFLFESVFLDWFENSDLADLFVDALANVSVKGERIEAEHDLLLASKAATLISIDAKTGTLLQKDLDARIQNLGKDSGDYARMAVVIPFDEDIFKMNLIQPKVLSLLKNISSSIPILPFGYRSEEIVFNETKRFKAISPVTFFSRLA